MKTHDNGIDRDMTEAEETAHLATLAQHAEENKALADALAARTAAREALLTRLGITAEEAQLLLGGL